MVVYVASAGLRAGVCGVGRVMYRCMWCPQGYVPVYVASLVIYGGVQYVASAVILAGVCGVIIDT